MWYKLISWLDNTLNHALPNNKPIWRRLCDYHDFLVIGFRTKP